MEGVLFHPHTRYRVFHVASHDEKLRRLIQIVKETEGAGVIYVNAPKTAQEIYDAVRRAGANVTLCHERLSKNDRERNQKRFVSGVSRVIVTTSAYTAEISKPNIRFIAHYQVPPSLEAYYQETSHAGKEGDPAWCTLLYDIHEKRMQPPSAIRPYPTASDMTSLYETLRTLSADENAVAYASFRNAANHIPPLKWRIAIKLLRDAGIIAQDEDRRYYLARPTNASEEIPRLTETYRDKCEQRREMLRRMIFYAQSKFCRWKVLLEYFGERPDWSRCHACDNCLRVRERTPVVPRRLKSSHRLSMGNNLLDFRTGELVRVPKYGEGRVISAVADRVTIAFPDSNTRTFLKSYVERERR